MVVSKEEANESGSASAPAMMDSRSMSAGRISDSGADDNEDEASDAEQEVLPNTEGNGSLGGPATEAEGTDGSNGVGDGVERAT